MFGIDKTNYATIAESFIWKRSVREIGKVTGCIAIRQTFVFPISVKIVYRQLNERNFLSAFFVNICRIYLLKASLRHAIFVKLHIGVASSPTDKKKNETTR